VNLLRALALPFQFTSLLFGGVLASLLALVASVAPALLPPRLFGLYLLLSWLNKYAFALLDHAANGQVEAPVASVELLGPAGDLRAWVYPTLAGLLALACWVWIPGRGVSISAVALLLWPASVAGLATTHELRDALDPRALWRNAIGLGRAYGLAIAGLAVVSILGLALGSSSLPSVLRYSGLVLLWFTLHALMGGVIFHRRHELGFEPSHSPEKTQARQDAERQRRFQRMVDRVFSACRARNTLEAQREIQDWFAPLDPIDFAHDRSALLARAEGWGDDWADGLIARELPVRTDRPGAAGGSARP
jgi:hypothetical protein